MTIDNWMYFDGKPSIVYADECTKEISLSYRMLSAILDLAQGMGHSIKVNTRVSATNIAKTFAR